MKGALSRLPLLSLIRAVSARLWPGESGSEVCWSSNRSGESSVLLLSWVGWSCPMRCSSCDTGVRSSSSATRRVCVCRCRRDGIAGTLPWFPDVGWVAELGWKLPGEASRNSLEAMPARTVRAPTGKPTQGIVMAQHAGGRMLRGW